MKKSNSLRSACLVILLAGSFGQLHAAPYGPEGREIKWVQPNGDKLNLRVFGDENYGRTETAGGYTVVYNPADGAYHYAGIAADGSNFVPSGALAGQPTGGNLRMHLDLAPDKIEAIANARHALLDKDADRRWADRVNAHELLRAAQNGAAPNANLKAAAVQAADVVGDKVGLTILVQFPNDTATGARDPINFPTDRAKMVRYCNGVGYTEDGNTGSIYDYYFDQSGGKLKYTQSVTQIITMPKARNYYNFSDYPKNTVLRGNSGDLLVADSITTLKAAGFNFTTLSVDSTSRILATNILFAGADSGVWAQGLWPLKTTLPNDINVGSVLVPIYVSNYMMTNIPDAAPVIGTVCHENGHLLLGYPDLYDYGGQSEGVGEHCLMGSGNYNNGGKTPSPIDAYLKDVVGWENVTDLAITDSLQTLLPTTGNVAYRITNPAAANEFFMFENRGDGDKWADYSVDKGIAIWHIDSNVFGDNNEQMTSAKHYQVSLEQADGLFDLEKNVNRGDTKDLFDLSKPIFSDITLPNAQWWSGSNSGIKFRVLTAAGSKTSVQFGALAPDTIIVGSPNGSEVLFPGTTFPITWEASIKGNVKIELYKGGSLFSVLSSNEANSGKFVWAVPANIAVGSDYSIKISSITNPIPASDSSNLPFTISGSTFPAGNAMPYGWYKPSSADKGWKVTHSIAYEGAYCLTNQVLGDGKTAAVAFDSNFKAGKITFYLKVSTEKKFDYARFYIDGNPRVLDVATGAKGLSGTTGWVPFSFNLTSGAHTLKWTYEKDDSYISGKDAVWLDGVTLPETTQEIAVEYPVGTNIESGTTTIHLPTLPMGVTSAAETVTIKNVGLASLTGLKVIKSGANNDDFSIGSLGTTTLGPGKSTTFKVSFTPSEIGLRTANIQILSNDKDESAFAIALDGIGIPAPKIVVSQPENTDLLNGKSKIDFGYAVVKSTNNIKTFTIRNAGTAVLDTLAVSFNGANAKDFFASALGVLSLAPGESTTFNVTFSPAAIDNRNAGLTITSNDSGTGPFAVSLAGIGSPNVLPSAAALASSTSSTSLSGIAQAVLGKDALAAAAKAPSVISVEVVNGKKYLSLTVTKPPGTAGVIRTVEVSSNLLDWYSGKNYTVTLINDATTLKVRDKTPTTSQARRYIHLKLGQH